MPPKSPIEPYPRHYAPRAHIHIIQKKKNQYYSRKRNQSYQKHNLYYSYDKDLAQNMLKTLNEKNPNTFELLSPPEPELILPMATINELNGTVQICMRDATHAIFEALEALQKTPGAPSPQVKTLLGAVPRIEDAITQIRNYMDLLELHQSPLFADEKLEEEFFKDVWEEIKELEK